MISNKRDEIIFVENKIDSPEGDNQLNRYAEHLDLNLSKSDFKKARLIYITRDWDKKDGKEIISKCENKLDIHFVQIRWQEIYRLLKKHIPNNNILVLETTRFMEENNMSRNNQFNSIDILTLMSYPELEKKLMDVMDSEVDEVLKAVAGTESVTQEMKLREKNRFINYTDLEVAGIKKSMWFGYGFAFDPSAIDGYPDLIVRIEVRESLRKNISFNKVINLLQNNLIDGWHDIQVEAIWWGIEKRKNIKEILSADDHIIESRNFLKATIPELKEKISDLMSLS